jgi:hypothetical protein
MEFDEGELSRDREQPLLSFRASTIQESRPQIHLWVAQSGLSEKRIVPQRWVALS